MITPKETKMLEHTLDMLSEHFSNITLLVSRPIAGALGGSTERYFNGRGDHFARMGQCNTYIKMHEPPLVATLQSPE